MFFAAFWTIVDYCLITYSLCCKHQIMCWHTLFSLSPIYCLHFANLHCFATSLLWDKMKIMLNLFVAIQCSVSLVTTYCKLGDKLHPFWTVVCWRVVGNFRFDAALHIIDCIDVWCAVFILVLHCRSLIKVYYIKIWYCLVVYWHVVYSFHLNAAWQILDQSALYIWCVVVHWQMVFSLPLYPVLQVLGQGVHSASWIIHVLLQRPETC